MWSCLFGAGKIVRYGPNGAQEVIETGAELTSDVTFGGPGLERMFFVSLSIGANDADEGAFNAGALVAVDGLGFQGRPEPRFRL